jgi:hypothetical protein
MKIKEIKKKIGRRIHCKNEEDEEKEEYRQRYQDSNSNTRLQVIKSFQYRALTLPSITYKINTRLV